MCWKRSVQKCALSGQGYFHLRPGDHLWWFARDTLKNLQKAVADYFTVRFHDSSHHELDRHPSNCEDEEALDSSRLRSPSAVICKFCSFRIDNHRPLHNTTTSPHKVEECKCQMQKGMINFVVCQSCTFILQRIGGNVESESRLNCTPFRRKSVTRPKVFTHVYSLILGTVRLCRADMCPACKPSPNHHIGWSEVRSHASPDVPLLIGSLAVAFHENPYQGSRSLRRSPRCLRLLAHVRFTCRSAWNSSPEVIMSSSTIHFRFVNFH